MRTLLLFLLLGAGCSAELERAPACEEGGFDGQGHTITIAEDIQLAAPIRPAARLDPMPFPNGSPFTIEGDTLKAKIKTGGGCINRHYQLHWDGAFDPTGGVWAGLDLTDSAEGCAADCAAVVFQEPEFSLLVLKDSFQSQFTQSGTIMLVINDQTPIEYDVVE